MKTLSAVTAFFAIAGMNGFSTNGLSTNGLRNMASVDANDL
jgi:hypothetical protein